MKFARASLIVCALLAAGSAAAADFRSVGVAPAVMFDAPTERGKKLSIAPRNMPVEVLQSSGSFTRVRDVSGEFSWIASRDLVPRRHVVVTAAAARVHQAPEEASPVVFSAERNVLLELSELPANGWVKVRHAEGQTGFVKAADVWGD
jgi:SH3-like domain-containing protein